MSWEQLWQAILSPINFNYFVVPMLIFTGMDAISFFTQRHLDFKWFLTTWGLFGTFVGIFIGLVGFDTTNIATSVPKLLDGLKLAFLTSIIGMALATVLQIIQQIVATLLFKNSDNEPTKLELLGETVFKEIKKLSNNSSKNTDNLHEFQELFETQQHSIQNLDTGIKAIYTVLENIQNILHENHRFIKLGPNGNIIEDNAEWIAVRDNKTSLVWEYKCVSGDHDRNRRFAWKSNNNNEIEEYVQATNTAKLASFNDWRLPLIAELETLFTNNNRPDYRYFGPITNPAKPSFFLFSSEFSPKDKESGMALQWDIGKAVSVAKAHVILVRGPS